MNPSSDRQATLPRHGRGHRVLPHEINFRANIHGMKQLGVERIISISAVGSMREEIRPGDVVETTGEITDLYARGALQFLVMRTESRRPDGRLVVEGTWTAVVRG